MGLFPQILSNSSLVLEVLFPQILRNSAGKHGDIENGKFKGLWEKHKSSHESKTDLVQIDDTDATAKKETNNANDDESEYIVGGEE